jgi:hypothetical protein
MILTGKPKFWVEETSRVTLYKLDSTCTGQGLNWALRGIRPASQRVNPDTATRGLRVEEMLNESDVVCVILVSSTFRDRQE